jgi:hypothetical protein
VDCVCLEEFLVTMVCFSLVRNKYRSEVKSCGLFADRLNVPKLSWTLDFYCRSLVENLR